MKRYLALLLAIIIFTTLIPTTIFAAPTIWSITVEGELPFEYGVTYRNDDGSQSPDTGTAPKNSQVTVFFIIPSGHKVAEIEVREATTALVLVSFTQGADYIEFKMPDNNVAVNITFEKTDTPPKPVVPRIKAQPQEATAAEKDTAKFSVTAIGAETYQWYAVGTKGGKDVPLKDWPGSALELNISGSGTNTLTLKNFLAEFDGLQFYCVISNSAGSTKSNAAKIVVTTPKPQQLRLPTIVAHPQDVTVDENGTIEFSVVAAGVGSVVYEWYVDGTLIYGNSPGFKFTDKAEYLEHDGLSVWCRVKNEAGFAESSKALIKVNTGGNKPTTPELTFTDVNTSDWFHAAVYNAVGMGLVNGTSPSTYDPYKNLTIAEAIKLAACMHQKYNTGSVTLQNGSKNWYDTYVAYAEQNEIIEKDKFAGRYTEYATRAEFVCIFYPALPSTDYKDINSVSYGAIPDVSSSDSYGNVVYNFYRAGILTGSDEKGTFYPKKNIQRNEVAAILSRMMDKSVRVTVTLP